MRQTWMLALVSALALAACGPGAGVAASRQGAPTSKPPEAGKGVRNVVFKPSEKQIRGEMQISFDKDGKPSIKDPGMLGLLCGEVEVDGEPYTLFIPAAGPFSLENTGMSNHLGSTATAVFVDSNSDGHPDDGEKWFANLPLRIGGKMFQVKEIARDVGWLQLEEKTGPLMGASVGWSAPNFEYKTTDGKTVRLADYKGKALLIDTWSYT